MDRDYRTAMVTMGIGFFGIILAAIEKVLYDEGIMIDEFITSTITITDLMGITIIIFLLVAVIVAVTQR